MKKYLFPLLLAGLLSACSGSSSLCKPKGKEITKEEFTTAAQSCKYYQVLPNGTPYTIKVDGTTTSYSKTNEVAEYDYKISGYVIFHYSGFGVRQKVTNNLKISGTLPVGTDEQYAYELIPDFSYCTIDPLTDDAYMIARGIVPIYYSNPYQIYIDYLPNDETGNYNKDLRTYTNDGLLSSYQGMSYYKYKAGQMSTEAKITEDYKITVTIGE